MAWTTPRTWVSGEVVTAAIMNAHVRDNLEWVEDANFRLGASSTATIASGVLTVTAGGYYKVAAESGTSDQVDSISLSGVAEGDLLFLIADAGDTITFDDANINLGAATRAVSAGGHLQLRYDGVESQWTEVTFLASSDNA